jgi:feruloyl esterase
LPNTTVTIAQAVPAGSFTTPFNATLINLPAFCRVAATLKPSGDSDIKIEVWLPAVAESRGAWNAKLLAVGNGGWAGSIPYAALAAALRRGTRPALPTRP